MPPLKVTPEELANAASAATRPEADLAAAARAVQGSAGAATGTPAAGGFEALLAAVGHDVPTLQTAVEDLASALARAAQNYERTETTNTSNFQGPR